MKNLIKKIAVIGGSGKAGKYLVRQLLHEGYHILALNRNPERLQTEHAALEVITGDVADREKLNTLLSGADAVISTLGSGAPPSQPNIFSVATENIVKAMKAKGLHRYIVITGLNVDTPGDRKGPIAKGATDWMYANYPKSTADRQLEYIKLTESGVDWTLVRLPLIEQTDTKAEVAVSLLDCPGDKISAGSLSVFLIRQLTDQTYIRSAPFVANV